MSRTPYDRWLKFLSRPTSESGLTFPTVGANAIMAIPLRRIEPNWRRTKREMNKAYKRATRNAPNRARAQTENVTFRKGPAVSWGGQ